MDKRETYLDWNATAPLRPEAEAAVIAALAYCGNPSSVHRWGRAARQLVERGREAVAALLGIPPAGIVFTSGGTEANHLALNGAGRARILVSAVEHSSVLQAVPSAEPIAVDNNGIVDLTRLRQLLAERPASCPRLGHAREQRDRGDAAGRRDLPRSRTRTVRCFIAMRCRPPASCRFAMTGIGADLISLSAHKIGGPPGIGALVTAGEVEPRATIRGGGQERGRRAGTENLPGIAGFAAAAEAAAAGIAAYDRVRRLRDGLEAAALAAIPQAMVIGAGLPRLPNTTALALPGVMAETQVIALDLAGVMVSAGAACSSGKVGPSHVLAAMRLPPAIAAATIRVSLGWTTTEADIAHFLDAWTALARRLSPRNTVRAA